MATIDIRRKHALGCEAARRCAEQIAQQLQAELKARYHWQDEVLKFDCPGAQGGIAVEEQAVRVEVELSFLLRPMRGRIEREINAYLDQYLR